MKTVNYKKKRLVKASVCALLAFVVVLAVFAVKLGVNRMPTSEKHTGSVTDSGSSQSSSAEKPETVTIPPTTAAPATEPATPDTTPIVPLPNGEYETTTAPAPVIPENAWVIYLTFDDGPAGTTSRLLDILGNYGVKATFFVTGFSPAHYDMLTREHNEGHAIGVHSLTHNYNKIYSSESAFWSDFDQMQEIIKQYTGSYTNIMRFPGGSSNTVSRITPGIMTALTKSMDEKGIAYFDWNVDSRDAGGASSASEVFENLKYGVSGMRNSVVLCHDIKDYTVEAMNDFIPWALQNGYVFATCSTQSYECRHYVNN